jgi:hypothetical protein
MSQAHTLHKLHLGCGQDHWEGYVNIDVDPSARADLVLDLKDLPKAFAPASVSEICGYHVLNYLSYWNACSFFRDAGRILAPGGVLILETVNLETVARLLLSAQGNLPQYFEGVRAIHGFGLDHMANAYAFTPNRFSWTPWHLQHELEAAGLSSVRLLPPQSHAAWRDMRVECIQAG